MTNRPKADRRRNRRTIRLRHLRVSWDGAPQGNHRISDLSADGVFINTPDPFPVETPIKLILEAPGKEIRTRAIVRHSITGKGMGVEFVEMEDYDRDRLRNLVEAVEAEESSKVEAAYKTPAAAGARSTSEESAAASPSMPSAHEKADGQKVPPPSGKGAERRKDRRRRFSARAEVVEPQSGEKVEARIRDLSHGGCYVDTKKPFALGSIVLVRVARKEGSFEARARVVYSATNKGMGLFFEAIAPDQLQIVERWLGESDWVASAGRKGQRLSVRVKVRVSGEDSTGAHFDEETHTRTISVLGGLIPLSAPVDEGQRLVLMNLGTRAQMECRVAYIGRSEGESNPVGVTFLLPNPRFWNVIFPPNSEPTESDETADIDHDDALRRVARSIAEETPKHGQRRLRVDAQIPVRLSWEEGEEQLTAEGTTVNVSAGGALLSVLRCAAIGQKMVLINSKTSERIECFVRYARQSESGPGQARVEFAEESTKFWGAAVLGIEEPRQRQAEQKPLPAPSAQSRQTRAASKAPMQNESSRVAGDLGEESDHASASVLSRHWRAVAGAGLGLVCALAWIVWSSRTPQGTGAAASASQPTLSLAGIPPEEASLIPDSAGYGLAKEADFEASADAWLHSVGVQASANIPGEYSSAGESHAYILKGAAGDWRVVIVADGRVRCDAHYKSVGIAARVPKAALNGIPWKNVSKIDSEGDGLLVVRSAQDAGSGVVLLLAGDQVISGMPSDYHQVPLR